MVTVYQNFVRDNLSRMPGRTPQDRMRALGAAWRKHKKAHGGVKSKSRRASRKTKSRPRPRKMRGGAVDDEEGGGRAFDTDVMAAIHVAWDNWKDQFEVAIKHFQWIKSPGGQKSANPFYDIVREDWERCFSSAGFARFVADMESFYNNTLTMDSDIDEEVRACLEDYISKRQYQ